MNQASLKQRQAPQGNTALPFVQRMPHAHSQSARPQREHEVRSVLAARRTREAMIGAALFADPAWDMLLELYLARLEQRRVSTSQLVLASVVPSTTALRWIDKIESIRLARRVGDPFDRRRLWVELTALGAAKMDSFFDAI